MEEWFYNEANTGTTNFFGMLTLVDSKGTHYIKSNNTKPKNWGVLVKYLNEITNNAVSL
mgnify:FL=1